LKASDRIERELAIEWLNYGVESIKPTAERVEGERHLLD
jgi:hypothetical protein